jgi:hypothetical protein
MSRQIGLGAKHTAGSRGMQLAAQAPTTTVNIDSLMMMMPLILARWTIL